MVTGIVSDRFVLQQFRVGKVHEIDMVVVGHHLLYLLLRGMLFQEDVRGHLVFAIDGLRGGTLTDLIALAIQHKFSQAVLDINRLSRFLINGIVVIHGLSYGIIDDISASVAQHVTTNGTVFHGIVTWRAIVVSVERIITELSLYFKRDGMCVQGIDHVSLGKHTVAFRGIHTHRTRRQIVYERTCRLLFGRSVDGRNQSCADRVADGYRIVAQIGSCGFLVGSTANQVITLQHKS